MYFSLILGSDITFISSSLPALQMEGSQNCSSCQAIKLEIWTSYLVENVSTPFLSCFGISGNILAIVIMKNPGMKSTFHQSLVALASCDLMFLRLILMDYSDNSSSQFYIIIFPYFMNPMKNILLWWETFLTMRITTERFLAVCKSLLYRTTTSSPTSSPRSSCLSISTFQCSWRLR